MSCIICGNTDNVVVFNGFAICLKCKLESTNSFIEHERDHIHEFTAPVQVLPNLYIGSIESCVSYEELKKRNITKIIVAGKFIHKYPHDDIEYLELLVDDSLEQDMKYPFDISCKFIDDNTTGNTLIYCYSGISRSASVVIAYLMKSIGMTHAEAYLLLKGKKDNINPNSNFVKQLKERE
jgi:predicted protein tyrosine phosphatase